MPWPNCSSLASKHKSASSTIITDIYQSMFMNMYTTDVMVYSVTYKYSCDIPEQNVQQK